MPLVLRWLFAISGVASAAAACLDGDPARLDPVAGALTIDVAALAFDDVYITDRLEQDVQLNNAGTGPLVLAPELSSAHFGLLDEGALELPPGVSASLTVRFAPAAPGAHLATLRVGGAPEVMQIQLSGTGLAFDNCDDGNACTDDEFVSGGEGCRHTHHDRSCDPDNACVENASCAEGVCLGTFIDCPPSPVACRESYCDGQLGCTTRDIPGACDDGDPCTEDVCGDNGCIHPAAEDGTNCGDYVPCETVAICQGGQCNTIPVPDGAPCDDGNLCTVDRCLAGVCIGEDTGPGDPAVGQVRTHRGTFATAVVALGDDRAVIQEPRYPPGGVPFPDAMVLTVLRRTGAGASTHWAIENVNHLDYGYRRMIADGDDAVLVTLQNNIARIPIDEDGQAGQREILPELDNAVARLDFVRDGVLFGCAWAFNGNETFGYRLAPNPAQPAYFVLPDAWNCNIPGVTPRYLPTQGLMTQSTQPNVLSYWDLTDVESPVYGELDVSSVFGGQMLNPTAWATEDVMGFFERDAEPPLFIIDLEAGSIVPMTAVFPSDPTSVTGVGSDLYVHDGTTVFRTENPGPQSLFVPVARNTKTLALVGDDLLKQVEGLSPNVTGLRSMRGTVDGRIGQVGALLRHDEGLALQSTFRLTTISAGDLQDTYTVAWHPPELGFTPRLVRYPPTFSPAALFVHVEQGPQTMTAGAYAHRVDHDNATQFFPGGDQFFVPSPLVGDDPMLTRRMFLHEGALFALDVVVVGEGSRSVEMARYELEPAVANVEPTWRQQLFASVVGPTRVYAAGSAQHVVWVMEYADGPVSFRIVDISDPLAAGPTAGTTYTPPSAASAMSVGMGQGTVIRAYVEQGQILLDRVVVQGAGGQRFQGPDIPGATGTPHVLDVADDVAAVATDGLLSYIDTETLQTLHQVAVDGNPEWAAGHNGRLYVASREGVTEIFPPCP